MNYECDTHRVPNKTNLFYKKQKEVYKNYKGVIFH